MTKNKCVPFFIWGLDLIIKGIAVLLFMIPSTLLAAEHTAQENIGQIEYDGNTDRLFVLNDTSSGWGASGCPDAKYVQSDPQIQGKKEILSLALAAKMAGNEVKFYGVCDPANLDNFLAYYIIVY